MIIETWIWHQRFVFLTLHCGKWKVRKVNHNILLAKYRGVSVWCSKNSRKYKGKIQYIQNVRRKLNDVINFKLGQFKIHKDFLLYILLLILQTYFDWGFLGHTRVWHYIGMLYAISSCVWECRHNELKWKAAPCFTQILKAYGPILSRLN